MSLVFDEAIGLEGRGSFYESYGALKDVFQNHLLQLLILAVSAGSMHDSSLADARSAALKRAALLRAIRIKKCVLGQYAGYKEEKNVAPDSTVNTFAAATLTIDTPQWRGVEFYVRTGKRLEKKLTELTVDFLPADSLSDKNHAYSRENNNAHGHKLQSQARVPHTQFICQYAPEQKIILALVAPVILPSVKITGKPAPTTLVTPADKLFTQIPLSSEKSPLATQEPYATLIEHLMRGDHACDVSVEEIEAQWQVVAQIQAKRPQLVVYAPGSSGPVLSAAPTGKKRLHLNERSK